MSHESHSQPTYGIYALVTLSQRAEVYHEGRSAMRTMCGRAIGFNGTRWHDAWQNEALEADGLTCCTDCLDATAVEHVRPVFLPGTPGVRAAA